MGTYTVMSEFYSDGRAFKYGCLRKWIVHAQGDSGSFFYDTWRMGS